MKKFLSCFVIVTLLFCLVFSTPAQAVDFKYVAYYVSENANSTWINPYYAVHPGSIEYWHTRTVEEQSWTDANRPEKMMGDANIDGKITAVDALFALHFSVNGNFQTAGIYSPSKTPQIIGWRSFFGLSYRDGELEERAKSPGTWWHYCMNNSPFFADVTKDCVVNAKDALEILKYCVGKAKDFPVGDFTTYSNRFHYYPWPTEYYPGMLNGDLIKKVTNEEYCKKFNLPFLEETPTDN